jgi:hypothetical protein
MSSTFYRSRSLTMSEEQGAMLSVQDMPVTYKTLVTLSTSPTVPEAYRNKPGDMLAVALQGRELGIGPMTSINNLDMIDGTISMRAKLMSALIHAAGHIIMTVKQEVDICELQCWRWHSPSNELVMVGNVSYTLEDATLAKDAKKDTYKKHPKGMLTNRALTLAARTFYGDVLAGIGYTAGELDPNISEDDIPVELLKQELDAEVIEVIDEHDDMDDGPDGKG